MKAYFTEIAENLVFGMSDNNKHHGQEAISQKGTKLNHLWVLQDLYSDKAIVDKLQRRVLIPNLPSKISLKKSILAPL